MIRTRWPLVTAGSPCGRMGGLAAPPTPTRRLLAAATLALLVLSPAAPALAGDAGPRTARFATFNASLNRNAEGELVADLSTPDDV